MTVENTAVSIINCNLPCMAMVKCSSSFSCTLFNTCAKVLVPISMTKQPTLCTVTHT